MSAFIIELRRSPALTAFPLLVGLGMMVAWRTLWPWVVAWPNSSSAIIGSVAVLGPMAAGLAAWAANRETRRGTADLHDLAARGPLAGPSIGLLATTAWAVLAYSLVIVAIATRTILGGAWGRPDVQWILVGALGLSLLSLLGFLIGRAVPKMFTPPLVTVGFYLLGAFASSAAGPEAWWAYLAPSVQIGQDVFEPSSQPFFAGQGLWYSGAGLLAFLLWQWRSIDKRRSWHSLGAVFGVALAATGVLLVANQKEPYKPETSTPYVCAGEAPVICVHPAYKRALHPMRSAIGPLASRLKGTSFELKKLEQRPFGRSAPQGAQPLYLNELYPSSYTRMALDQLVRSIFTGRCSSLAFDPLSADKTMAYLNMIEAWLLGNANAIEVPDTQIQRAYQQFSSMTENERHRWLLLHQDDIIRCRLRPADFT